MSRYKDTASQFEIKSSLSFFSSRIISSDPSFHSCAVMTGSTPTIYALQLAFLSPAPPDPPL